MAGEPDDLAGLRQATSDYADHLLATADLFRPEATSGLWNVFVVPTRVGPEAVPWGWAEFLLAWPEWRPHRLPLTLTLPPPGQLADLAARLRATPLTEDTAREVADLLDRMASPSAEVQAALDRAAELGREVENRLAALPADWPPVRLARAATVLGDWPQPGGLWVWLYDQATDEADGLGQILDEVAKLDPTADAAHLAARDDLLSLVRGWAGDIGLAVSPTDWSFCDGGPAPPADAPGVVTKVVFRRDVPAGRVARVKAFGLVRGDEVIRPAEVVVSAGPPPAGLTELEAAAGAIPGPAGEAVREAFRDLRPAGLGGYLELAAVELYTRFWDRAYADWAATDPAAAAAFGAGLGAMMRDGFGLTPFDPVNFRDYPAGWVAVPPGTRMTTGRVVRVLRPGLAAGDVLRVPARAEAE